MQPVLFDSSLYIEALRADRDPSIHFRRLAAGAPIWLSAVVLEELYSGVNVRDRHVIETFERNFALVGRLLVPNLTDWTRTGIVLSQLSAKYGHEQIGKGRLTNDALIAMSAGRMGIAVVTSNERDFSRLAEFRPFDFRVQR